MGRVKLAIRRIENKPSRQVEAAERAGQQAAYELCVLCDMDLALLMLSPSARLTHFSSRRGVENVIRRYVGARRGRDGEPASEADQQDLYDATSQMLGLHHGDPCVAGLGGNACTELLPTLIPATRAFPHPLTMPPHCLAPDDEQFLAMQDGRGMVTAHQQQVEAPASASASVTCSYVPSDDTGTPAMAYDSAAPPANFA